MHATAWLLFVTRSILTMAPDSYVPEPVLWKDVQMVMRWNGPSYGSVLHKALPYSLFSGAWAVILGHFLKVEYLSYFAEKYTVSLPLHGLHRSVFF